MIGCTATLDGYDCEHECNQPSRHDGPHICCVCGMTWPWVSP